MAEKALKSGAETYSSAIKDAVNYTRWVLSPFIGHVGESVLEVGLGHGSYREQLPAHKRYVGVDIDAESIERARRRDPENTYLCADITSDAFVDALKDNAVDTVMCFNVIEHIEDHRLAVENLCRALRPGGRLLLFVPAFQQLYSDLDRLAGHFRRYRRPDLLGLLPPGMRVVRCRYFNAVGGLGWWLNKGARHDSLDSEAVNRQIRLFDRWLVGPARLIDAFVNRWFGQSVYLIAEKP